MQENNFTQIEKDLQQIADMMLLNGTLTECPGLMHGKMGITVFFFHYAQHTGNELYADYAMDLMDEMLNQIHVNSPADYEKGIAGIGVGFDYLIRNNFLVVEDDICEDFDDRMVRAVRYDPCPDFSQYNGLTGYGRYWVTRLRYQSPSIQARECLSFIITRIEENIPNLSTTELTDVIRFLHDLQGIEGFDQCAGLLDQCWRIPDFNEPSPHEMDIALEQIPNLDLEKVPVSMGLLNGYAGEGLLRLTALAQTNKSWMQLL
ncbi:MAG: hypothetical protein LBV74_03295 [Tannerella sp.]|jgi:hypothetical protein|nr:hypothetical protein [Tannerella sp.]